MDEPRETPRALVVLHNVSVDKIRKAADLGGLPMPSLAVLPHGMSFDGFGGVTLVADPRLADPSAGGARLFAADVYSPRVPEPEWRIDGKALLTLFRLLQATSAETNEYHDDLEHRAERGRDCLHDSMATSSAAKLAWLREAGHAAPSVPRVPMPLATSFSDMPSVLAFHRANPTADLRAPGFAAALRAGIGEWRARMTAAGLKEVSINAVSGGEFDDDGLLRFEKVRRYEADREILLTGKTQVDRDACERLLADAVDAAGSHSFEAWVDSWCDRVCIDPRVRVGGRRLPYTLDNVVSAMRRMAVRGGEGGLTFSLGRARSVAAPQLASLDYAAREAYRIVDEAAFNAAKEANEKEFFVLRDRLEHRYEGVPRSANPFTRGTELLDDLARSLFDYYRGRRGPEGMQAALRRNHFEGVAPDEASEAFTFANALAAMPTQYFEAKLWRGVALGEFLAAAIPEGAPSDVEALLNRNGIHRTVRYADGERTAAVARLAEEVGAVHAPPEAALSIAPPGL